MIKGLSKDSLGFSQLWWIQQTLLSFLCIADKKCHMPASNWKIAACKEADSAPACTAECAEFTGQESHQVCLEQKSFNALQSIQAFPFFGGIGND
jgi:hypothetical protein